MPAFWSKFLDLFRKDPSSKHFDNAMKYIDQYNKTHVIDDLNTSISYFQISHRQRSKTKGKHARYSLDKILTHYSDAVWTRYTTDKVKYSADMDQVIELDEEICGIWGAQAQGDQAAAISAQHSRKLLDLANLHTAKCTKYMNEFKDSGKGELKGLAEGSYEKAVSRVRAVLFEMPTVPPEVRWMARVIHGVVVTTWCDHHVPREIAQGTRESLRAAMVDMADALRTGAPRTTDVGELAKFGATPEGCMRTLAIAHQVCSQFSEVLGEGDLDEAIRWNRALLERIRPSHGEYVYCKFDLAQQLFQKYGIEKRTGQGDDTRYLSATTTLTASHGAPGLQTLNEAEEVARELKEELERMTLESGVRQYESVERDLDRLLDTVYAHSSHSGSKRSLIQRTPSPAPSSAHASPSGASP